jgi:alpha-tubulin suppressor-like RCC1 family protein
MLTVLLAGAKPGQRRPDVYWPETTYVAQPFTGVYVISPSGSALYGMLAGMLLAGLILAVAVATLAPALRRRVVAFALPAAVPVLVDWVALAGWRVSTDNRGQAVPLVLAQWLMLFGLPVRRNPRWHALERHPLRRMSRANVGSGLMELRSGRRLRWLGIATLGAAIAAFVMVVAWPATAANPPRPSALFAWGGNSFGQVGNGTTAGFVPDPFAVHRFDGRVVQAAAGDGFSLALLSDGTVWGWGFNGAGQLGDNTTTNRLIPVQVHNLHNIVQLAVGESHGLAVQSDGSVWSWGANGHGQLGDGTLTAHVEPRKLSTFTDVVGVAAGHFHSVARRANGEVFAWGFDKFGQLGTGRDLSDPVPAHWDQLTPVRTRAPYGVIQIAAAGNTTMAMRSVPLGGAVFTWGYNGSGQLGDGTFATNSTPRLALRDGRTIGMSQDSSYAVGADTHLYAWGSDHCGSLGDGGTTDSPDQNRPKQTAFTGAVQLDAGFDSAVAVRGDGSLWRWGLYGVDARGCGPSTAPSPVQVPGLTGVSQASLSNSNTYLVVTGTPTAPPTTPVPTTPAPTTPIPTSPVPTSPFPTSPLPTSPRPTTPQPTSPRPTTPLPTTPLPTSPVPSPSPH